MLASSTPEPDDPSSSASAGARDPETEVEALRDTASLLEALGAPENELARLRTLLEDAGRGDAPTKGPLRSARELALSLDDRIPIPLLRARFHKDLLPFEGWLRYLGFVADHADRPSRWDRIEFVATRIFSTENDDGSIVPMSRAEMTAGIARVSGLRVAREDRREAAIGFLGNAARRITSFSSVQDLFDSGLYEDVQAYKATLKGERLDPGIFSSLLLLNIAITNHLLKCERERAAAQAKEPVPRPIDTATLDIEIAEDALSDAGAGLAVEPSSADAVSDHEAPTTPRALEPLEQRIDAVRAALALYRKMEVEAALLEELSALGEDLSSGLDEVLALPAGAPEREARRASLAAQVTEGERLFLSIDEELPPTWFEEKLDRRLLSDEEWFLYARALVDHADTTARRDRVERVTTLLLTRRLPDGQLELLSDSECLMAIARIAPTPLADEARREACMKFLTDAVQRLADMSSVRDVLESGLYLDLQGYKIALRKERLDPGILYAIVLTRVALNNHLVSFAASEGITPEEVARRIAQKDEEVTNVLAEDERVARERRARVTRARPTERSAPAKAKAAAMPAPGRGPLLQRVAGLVLLAASIALYFLVVPRPQNQLVEMSVSDVGTLGDFLESGSLSRGQRQRIFLGKVKGAKWLFMSLDERRKAADELRQSLLRRNVTSAMVFRDATLVVHIDQSRVILVE